MHSQSFYGKSSAKRVSASHKRRLDFRQGSESPEDAKIRRLLMDYDFSWKAHRINLTPTKQAMELLRLEWEEDSDAEVIDAAEMIEGSDDEVMAPGVVALENVLQVHKEEFREAAISVGEVPGTSGVSIRERGKREKKKVRKLERDAAGISVVGGSVGEAGVVRGSVGACSGATGRGIYAKKKTKGKFVRGPAGVGVLGGDAGGVGDAVRSVGGGDSNAGGVGDAGSSVGDAVSSVGGGDGDAGVLGMLGVLEMVMLEVLELLEEEMVMLGGWRC
ncbi:uncharacterized protein [Macrobrachium rosenbergii]|uniref:uncharacterized protein n=1 Tax=Macrobrachium rosenbergii TaxID=79674 RepID=UPI0034D4FBEE